MSEDLWKVSISGRRLVDTLKENCRKSRVTILGYFHSEGGHYIAIKTGNAISAYNKAIELGITTQEEIRILSNLVLDKNKSDTWKYIFKNYKSILEVF